MHIYESKSPPRKVIKTILKHYNNFNNYKNGKVFQNSQTDPKFSFQGLMYDNAVENIGTSVPMLRLIELMDENLESENDLFIPYTMNLNKIAYFDILDNLHRTDVLRIILNSNVLNDYLYYYLNSNKCIHDISYLTLDFRDLWSIFYLWVPVPPY